MVRFDARMAMVALQALFIACGSGSHQPELPAAVPPSVPSSPSPKAEPKTAPRDSGAGSETYPWKSGPIAAL
jgi:hypothetical protein